MLSGDMGGPWQEIGPPDIAGRAAMGKGLIRPYSAGVAPLRTACSDRRPITMQTQSSSSTMVKGRPVEITIACSEARPPPISNAMATSPSKVHQNTRCGTGASILPPAVIVSITSEPESDEVTKKHDHQHDP